jgi:hypothetical protein
MHARTWKAPSPQEEFESAVICDTWTCQKRQPGSSYLTWHYQCCFTPSPSPFLTLSRSNTHTHTRAGNAAKATACLNCLPGTNGNGWNCHQCFGASGGDDGKLSSCFACAGAGEWGSWAEAR